MENEKETKIIILKDSRLRLVLNCGLYWVMFVKMIYGCMKYFLKIESFCDFESRRIVGELLTFQMNFVFIVVFLRGIIFFFLL